MATASPSRRVVSRTRTALAVAAAALALTGCSATNPITTSVGHNVVDGIQVEVTDDVRAEGLLVLAGAQGEAGTMIGALTNQGREDVEVTVTADGTGAVTVDVPARGTVLLGDAGEPVELDSVGVEPGALLPVELSTPLGGGIQVGVPVLDGSLPEYADVVPGDAA